MPHAEAADPTLGVGGGALGAIDRLVHRIEKFTALISGFGIYALMWLGVVHVLGRKFFDMPVFGYIDLVEIMMAFMVFLAISYTERLGGHIRMELFVSRLKGRWLALFELAGVVLGLAMIAVLLVYSWSHAMRAFYLGDSTIDAQIPLWPSKLVVPVALGLLFARLCVSLWAYLRVILDPGKKLIAVPVVLDAEEQALREAEAAGAFEPDSAQTVGATGGTR
jgi:TRAP-type mannitol/chloroaromatic compound transport system permease small subunit